MTFGETLRKSDGKQETDPESSGNGAEGTLSEKQNGEAAPDQGAAEGSPEQPETDQIQRLMKYGSIAAGVIILGILLMIIGRVSGVFSAFSKDPVETSSTATAVETTESSEADYRISIQGEDLMPDIVGKTVAEAQAKLSTMGISLDSSKTEFSDTYYEGLIIQQDPEAEEAVIPGITVHATVSLGTKASYTLKQITGMSLADAQAALENAGVGTAEVREEFSDSVEKNCVIRWQSTGDSTEVKEGDSVILIVSRGKQEDLVRVPSVVNLSQDDARRTLEAAGLALGAVSTENSETASGIVIRQGVDANQSVARGTQIPVVLSSGTAEQQAGPGEAQPLSQEPHVQGAAGSSEPAYYGSIDTVCSAGMASGPNAQGEFINIQIRLVQRAEDSYEYVTLQDLEAVPAGTEFPVSFPSIKGIPGVETGQVQVLNADTGELIASYDVAFGPR